MTQRKARERSGNELAFALLKTLMRAYHLWGDGGGVEVATLPDAFRVSTRRLGGVLAYLVDEGLVDVDADAGTVRLSASGAQHLLGGTGK